MATTMSSAMTVNLGDHWCGGAEKYRSMDIDGQSPRPLSLSDV
jgi:hypothetical protein